MSIPRKELHQLIDKLKEEQVKKMLVIAKDLFEETKKKKTKWPGSSLFRLAGTIEGPSDLAEQHDRYLAEALEKRKA